MNYNVVELEQGSQEWLEFRKGKIGGSDIPAIMGCIDAHQKRSELLADKISNNEKEHSDFVKAMFAEGHEIERLARDAFNERTGIIYTPKVVQSKQFPNFIASLDGISEGMNIVIEIKSTRKKSILEDVRNKIVPNVYNLQIQWQLYITDIKFAYLIVVDSITRETYILLVDRDDQLIEKIKFEAAKFLYEMNNTELVEPKTLVVENATMQEIAVARQSVKELQNQLDIFDEMIKKHAAQLLKEFGATRIEGFGVVIQEVERAGSVDYAKIPELKGVDLERYRKKPTRYVKISEKKEN